MASMSPSIPPEETLDGWGFYRDVIRDDYETWHRWVRKPIRRYARIGIVSRMRQT